MVVIDQKSGCQSKSCWKKYFYEQGKGIKEGMGKTFMILLGAAACIILPIWINIQLMRSSERQQFGRVLALILLLIVLGVIARAVGGGPLFQPDDYLYR